MSIRTHTTTPEALNLVAVEDGYDLGDDGYDLHDATSGFRLLIEDPGNMETFLIVGTPSAIRAALLQALAVLDFPRPPVDVSGLVDPDG